MYYSVSRCTSQSGKTSYQPLSHSYHIASVFILFDGSSFDWRVMAYLLLPKLSALLLPKLSAICCCVQNRPLLWRLDQRLSSKTADPYGWILQIAIARHLCLPLPGVTCIWYGLLHCCIGMQTNAIDRSSHTLTFDLILTFDLNLCIVYVVKLHIKAMT